MGDLPAIPLRRNARRCVSSERIAATLPLWVPKIKPLSLYRTRLGQCVHEVTGSVGITHLWPSSNHTDHPNPATSDPGPQFGKMPFTGRTEKWAVRDQEQTSLAHSSESPKSMQSRDGIYLHVYGLECSALLLGTSVFHGHKIAQRH